MHSAEAAIQQLEDLCLARGLTIGFAESCTGGLMSSWLTARPGVSSFFLGAVVSYARSVKNQVLGVPLSLMQVHGEVSLPVATSMAHGARKVLGCDWAISVTGIAGPGGGSKDKPVGTVCFAITGPSFEQATHKQFPAGGGRQDIQRQAALFAFEFLVSAMR